jgi:oxygen-independent coproporphyrinogen-3 oxidase
VAYDADAMKTYMTALGREVELVASRIGSRVECSSLYLGGGSPALALEYLPSLLALIDARFRLTGPKAIELHPSDVTEENARKLASLGFSMVSLGVQTFQEKLNLDIGREFTDPSPALERLTTAGFQTIDTDLLFGLPGQTSDMLEADLRRAVALGATQISAYPFISFSYAKTPRVLPGIRARKGLLKTLETTAASLGLERSSIWTFAKPGSSAYSSVTRENFLGFGASATTLLPDLFKIDTFSVDAYTTRLAQGQLPTALTLPFTRRTRALYWLFWNAYLTRLSRQDYTRMFGGSLDDDFRPELRLARRLGIIEDADYGFALTGRGRYLFHLVEQAYTTEYIDRTWNSCRTQAWPASLELY